MINAKRITALFLSATMFVSIIGGSALATPETSNPGVGADGYVALQQYIQPTSDPNIFKVSMSIQAPMDPKPADVMIVLDASRSMMAAMSGTGSPSRWAGAIEGANAAIEVFTNPDKNPAADKTRVGVSIYNDDSDDIVTLTSDKGDISKGMGTLNGFYSMTGGAALPAVRPNLKTRFGNATNFLLGVQDAYNQFEGNAANITSAGGANDWLPQPKASEPGTRKYVIFLSDGINTTTTVINDTIGDPSVALDLASYMKVNQDVSFMTIGLGVQNVNRDSSGGADPSSLDPAQSENYRSWNKKSTVDYKAMINPLLSTASGNTYPNNNATPGNATTWFNPPLNWTIGGGGFFTGLLAAGNNQAESSLGLAATIPNALNREQGSPLIPVSPGSFHPNALVDISAMHSGTALGAGVNTRWLAKDSDNVWNGTEGYIDIPGDQYWSPGSMSTDSVSDGPQSLIYMAQMLNKQKIASRSIGFNPAAATGGSSYINTWETSSPFLWGFGPNPGGSNAVSSSSLNKGTFYWDNWISKQIFDLESTFPSGGPAAYMPTDVSTLYTGAPAAAYTLYSTNWAGTTPTIQPEAPDLKSIGDVYNADTVLRDSDGQIVEPNFRPVATLAEVVAAFQEFANKIIRFGENVKVDANINNNWEIVDRYGDMPDWYTLVGGFEGQTVTRSGNNVIWNPIAIPMIGQSTLTYYVRFTGNQTDKNMYYPIFDNCQISFMDNFDTQNIVNRVKNFPTIFANPSTNEVKESNVVNPNTVNNGGSPSTIGTTGNVINDMSSSATLNTNSTTSYQGAGGGIAFLGTGPQVYTASVTNTAAAKKNKKTAVDTSNDPEVLSDSEYKAVKGKSLKAKSGKVAVYTEPKKNSDVVLYINKGKTFKIAGATDKYYMMQYKKKDGKVEKGYILKTDVSLVK